MKFTKKYGENTFITYEGNELYTGRWDWLKYPLICAIGTSLLLGVLFLLSWIFG